MRIIVLAQLGLVATASQFAALVSAPDRPCDAVQARAGDYGIHDDTGSTKGAVAFQTQMP